LQIERVMDILGIHSGSNVADIGAGSGWFTVRAAKRVGARGTVYAVDINPEAINLHRQSAPQRRDPQRSHHFGNGRQSEAARGQRRFRFDT
jgi:ubiquinone/menaquinone biosynthesis C-methylase UbiE